MHYDAAKLYDILWMLFPPSYQPYRKKWMNMKYETGTCIEQIANWRQICARRLFYKYKFYLFSKQKHHEKHIKYNKTFICNFIHRHFVWNISFVCLLCHKAHGNCINIAGWNVSMCADVFGKKTMFCGSHKATDKKKDINYCNFTLHKSFFFLRQLFIIVQFCGCFKALFNRKFNQCLYLFFMMLKTFH